LRNGLDDPSLESFTLEHTHHSPVTLGLAQIGLLAATRADCHILRKNGGAHMRFTGLLMALVCAAALFVPGQEDAERVVQSKIIALE
jgi:hypothetical protein